MQVGIDPQGDERDLAHQLAGLTLDRVRAPPLAHPPVIEERRGVVLDLQNVPAVERFAADQGIAPLFELEAQEICRGHELRLPALTEQRIEGTRTRARGWGRRVVISGAPGTLGASGALGLGSGAAAIALLGGLQ